MPPCRFLAGIDLSHFDSPSIGTAVSEGIAFITHKAGGDRDDLELATWWAGVESYSPDRLLLGAYWVLYPGNPSGRADAFLARLDTQCPGWRDRPFMLQADCERWNGDPATQPGKADIQAFCQRLESRMPRLKPIVYAPQWAYGDTLTGLGYPLWASRYVGGTGPFRDLYPGDGSAKWAAYSGQVPAVLQYTSSATIGGQTTCDANAYRGTLDQLTALVAPGWVDDVSAQDVIDALKSPAGRDAIYAAVNQDTIQRYDAAGKPVPATAAGQNNNPTMTWASALAYVARDTGMLKAALTTLAGRDFTDEQAIVVGVLAGLDPAAIAAAIPQEVAQQVAAELAARLQA